MKAAIQIATRIKYTTSGKVRLVKNSWKSKSSFGIDVVLLAALDVELPFDVGDAGFEVLEVGRAGKDACVQVPE